MTGCGTERKSQVLGRDQITFPFFLNYSLPVLSGDWLSFVSFWGAPPSSLPNSLNFIWTPLPSPSRRSAWELQPAGGQLHSLGREEVRLSSGAGELGRCDELCRCALAVLGVGDLETLGSLGS